jgi:F-type H+-transporting ATPase subunit alpha
VGRSVSRVGGKAQLAAFRAVSGDLKLVYAQFEELETFARFGAHLDGATQTSITHGQRIRACLKQSELHPLPVPGQLAILLALTAGLFDPVPLERIAEVQEAVVEAARHGIAESLEQRLLHGDALSDEDRAVMIELARAAIAVCIPASAGDPRQAAGPSPPQQD